MRKLFSAFITIIFSAVIFLMPTFSKEAKAAGAPVTKTTAMECSVWSAPNTSEEYRVKKIPSGYNVTVYPDVVASSISDGKTFYQTTKGCYILCKCFDEAAAPAVPVVPSAVTATTGIRPEYMAYRNKVELLDYYIEKIYELKGQADCPYECTAITNGGNVYTQGIGRADDALYLDMLAEGAILSPLRPNPKYAPALAELASLFGIQNLSDKMEVATKIMSFFSDGNIWEIERIPPVTKEEAELHINDGWAVTYCRSQIVPYGTGTAGMNSYIILECLRTFGIDGGDIRIRHKWDQDTYIPYALIDGKKYYTYFEEIRCTGVKTHFMCDEQTLMTSHVFHLPEIEVNEYRKEGYDNIFVRKIK